MNGMTHKHIIRGTIALVALMATVAVALVLSRPQPSDARAVTRAASVAYTALDQASSSDARPGHSSLVGRMAAQHPDLGLRPADARVLSGVALPGEPLAVVAAIPANKAPCLYWDTGSSERLSCGTNDGDTAVVSYDGSIGMVPDSVTSVTYTMADGTEQVGNVASNVWHAPAEATSVMFSLGGERHTIDLMSRSSRPPGP